VGGRIVTLAAALLAGLLAAGCVFTPEASQQQDTLAKEFVTHPHAATIYVYRSRFNHQDADSMLYLDGRMIGGTQPGTYFRIDTTPGVHTLHGTGSDVGQLMLDMRGGQLYFVSVEMVGGHSVFRRVSEDLGREHVRACCVLLETLIPMRPFVLK
jgi:hypothetical protein